MHRMEFVVMAWTAPRTWVADEIVTAALLNAQLRDNLLVLSTHAHTGAAGMGASTLSAVTLTSLATATFADQSGNPSTNGRLQRNGANLLYYDGSTAIDLTASDQAAGTASLRTLGTGSTQAAAGDHTHAITFAFVQATASGSEVTSTTWETGETDEKDVVDHPITPGAATNRTIALAFMGNTYYSGIGSTAQASGFTLKFKLGGTTIRTITGAAGMTHTVAQLGTLYSASHQPDSTSEQTYKVTAANSATWGGGYEMVMLGTLSLTEISGAA